MGVWNYKNWSFNHTVPWTESRLKTTMSEQQKHFTPAHLQTKQHELRERENPLTTIY